MFISFDQLPDRSRLWIYQTSKPLSTREEALIQKKAQSFCEEWKAHGHPLTASFILERHHFFILAVDESAGGASGCSIDGSVRMIRELQHLTGIDFLDRSGVGFIQDGNVRFIPVKELSNAIATGAINPATPTINLQAATVADWRKGSILPAGNTWLSRYFVKTVSP
jgi:hypothetical protein